VILTFAYFVQSLPLNSQNSEHLINTQHETPLYKSITFNGIWSWFSDPRAVYYEGKHKRTYIGWIDNYGDIHIAFYDHTNNEINAHVIYDGLEIDDHNNPSILIDHSGYLHVFFNTHFQGKKPIYHIKSKQPEDISSWQELKELYLNDDERYRDAKSLSHTYTNPVQLKSENDKIYLFWRGVNLNPTYATSNDDGNKWTKGRLLFLPEEGLEKKVPYTKVYSDGTSKIHFTFTSTHPHNTTPNTLYYAYYEAGSFFKASGEKIKDLNALPLRPSELDLIYQSKNEKVWNWDIAQDKNGNAVLGFATFEDTQNHIYNYSTWQNSKWVNHKLVNSGNWFPEDQQTNTQPEPYYSGGLSFNHENPNIIYLSIKTNNIFEIEKWTTNNHGETWAKQPITKNSKKNNIRPYAIKNSNHDGEMQVLWLQIEKYLYYSLQSKTVEITFKDRFKSSIKSDLQIKYLENRPLEEKILEFSQLLMDYQITKLNTNIKDSSIDYGLFFKALKNLANTSRNNTYSAEVNNRLEIDNEDNEELEISNDELIWYYKVNNSRSFSNRLDTININAYQNISNAIDFASLIELSLKQTDINAKEEIYRLLKKNLYKINSLTLLNANNDGSFQSSIYENSLALYIMLWLENNDINHSDNSKTYSTQIEALYKTLQFDYTKDKNNINLKTNSAFILAATEYLKFYKS
jgi:hypothetical protein